MKTITKHKIDKLGPIRARLENMWPIGPMDQLAKNAVIDGLNLENVEKREGDVAAERGPVAEARASVLLVDVDVGSHRDGGEGRGDQNLVHPVLGRKS